MSRWYLEIRERRAGGTDLIWAGPRIGRSDFRHGLLQPELRHLALGGQGDLDVALEPERLAALAQKVVDRDHRPVARRLAVREDGSSDRS